MTDSESCDAPKTVYLGLGSSLGDRVASLHEALKRLNGKRGLSLIEVSPIYESPHMGLEPGDEAKYPSHYNLARHVRDDARA